MHQDNLFTRRSFIKSGALGLTGLTLGMPGLIAHAGSHDTVRVGVIGVGSRGGGISNIIRHLPGIEVVACADILESRLAQATRNAAGRIRAYQDYRRLLEDRDVDAVIVAVPGFLHYSVAVAALQAGKHVYLEKTMTHTMEEADDLVNVAKRYPKQVLQVGHQYRYYMLYHKVLEIIESGWVGSVYQYECQYHRNSDWRQPVSDPALEHHINWRMYSAYCGGLMTELSSHQVDIMNWFNGGAPLGVTAVGGIDRWKDGRDTYDNIRAVFEYPEGVKASVSSILSNAYNGYSIRVLGTEGTIEILQDRAFYYPERVAKQLTTVDGVTGATADSRGQGEQRPIEFDSQDGEDRDPTAYALLDFVECVRTGKKPLCNVETGRTGAKSVILANRAAATRQTELWS